MLMSLEKTEKQCSICYYTIKQSQMKTLICNHSFHMKCIWNWLVLSNICPLCRIEVSKYPEYGCQENEYIYYVNALIKKHKK